MCVAHLRGDMARRGRRPGILPLRGCRARVSLVDDDHHGPWRAAPRAALEVASVSPTTSSGSSEMTQGRRSPRSRTARGTICRPTGPQSRYHRQAVERARFTAPRLHAAAPWRRRADNRSSVPWADELEEAVHGAEETFFSDRKRSRRGACRSRGLTGSTRSDRSRNAAVSFASSAGEVGKILIGRSAVVA